MAGVIPRSNTEKPQVRPQASINGNVDHRDRAKSEMPTRVVPKPSDPPTRPVPVPPKRAVPNPYETSNGSRNRASTEGPSRPAPKPVEDDGRPQPKPRPRSATADKFQVSGTGGGVVC